MIVGAIGAGWVAATRVKSPAQLAAQVAPPIASLITYPVEKRVLSSDLIVRGTVRYSDPISVILAPSLLKPATVLVTTPPVKGTTINEGDVVLVVSGRPVVALSGAAPGYRDLGPGVVGNDVRQLEESLKRLGFNPGPVDGIYDAATAAAVAAWYTKAGYAPFGPNDLQRTNLRLTQSGVAQATDRLLQARQSEAVARQGTKPADIVDAKLAITSADAAIVSAQSTADRDASRGIADIATRETTLQTANIALDDVRRRAGLAANGINTSTGLTATPEQLAQLDQAIADANAAITSADSEVASSLSIADTVRRFGEAAVADAKTKLAIAATSAADLSPQQQLDFFNAYRAAQSAVLTAEATTAKDNSVAAADVTGKTNAVNAAKSKAIQAQRRLDTARTGVDPVTGLPAVTPGDQAATATALKQAEITAAAAQGDLAAMRRTVEMTATADAQAIVDARARADATRSRLNALISPAIGIKTLHDAVTVAQAEVTRLSAELGKTTATVGVQVPANEVVFFPSLPLRIDDTKIKRGDPATAEVMTVSGTHLAIDSSLLTTEAPLTRLDAPVSIDAPDYGFTSKGHISFLADKPGLRGTDAQHVAIELLPDDAPVALVGASVRITIPTKTTDGEALIVPVAALSVRADGNTQLQIEDKPGSTRTVVVTPGLSAQGFVAVVPVGGPVSVGDRVVIGTKLPVTASARGAPPDTSSSPTPSTVGGAPRVASSVTGASAPTGANSVP